MKEEGEQEREEQEKEEDGQEDSFLLKAQYMIPVKGEKRGVYFVS